MKNLFDDVNTLRETLSMPVEIELKIPNEMPEDYTQTHSRLEDVPFRSIKALRLRDAYNEAGMYGFVSWRWVDPFVKWINGRKCLEIMSGRGWLSYALQQRGVNVIPTDNFSWHQNFKEWYDTLTDVECIDAINAVEKYGLDIDIVIVSWPQANDTAFKVLKKLYEINSNAVFVFIGEEKVEVCADPNFYKHFEKINDEEFLLVADKYQSWFNFPDRLILGRYKEII
ncbi:hypothetical protein [Priestia aryabhattai]